MFKRPKHETTDSYFYIAINIAKFMMIADTLNLHVGPVRTEITGTQQITISHIFDLNKREPKEILADKILS